VATKVDLVPYAGSHRILVMPAWGQKTTVSLMPGAQRRQNGFSFPPNMRYYEYISGVLGNVESTGRVIRWYAEGCRRESDLRSVKLAQDAHVDHPSAHRLDPYQRVAVAYGLATRALLNADDCGLGKCLSGTTQLLGSDYRPVLLQDVPEGCSILGYDFASSSICNVTVTEVFDRGRLPALRITTRTGRKVVCSYRHKFLCFPYTWVEARDLTVGDRITAAKYLLNVVDYSGVRDEELALLGWAIAEGELSYGSSIHNYAADVLDDVKIQAKALGFGTRPVKLKREGEFGVYLSNARPWLRRWGLFGTNAYTKHVPYELFSCSRKQLKVFLCRLFRGDGCFYEARGRLNFEYDSMSERLCRDVQLLLLRFGILSNVKEIPIKGRYGMAWRTSVFSKASLEILVTEIGQFGKPQEEWKELLSRIESSRRGGGARVDAIPATWKTLLKSSPTQLAQKSGIMHHSWYYNKYKASTRSLVEEIAWADENVPLTTLLDGDTFWDEIIDIEAIAPRRMFDIAIDHPDKAFLADTFVTHNTATSVVTVEASGRDRRVLVVCRNPIKWWWQDEICAWSKHADPSITILGSGKAKREEQLRGYREGWLIVNWAALRLLPQLGHMGWDWAILDEAHHIKTPKAQRSQAIRRLQAGGRLALTATPFSNDVAELWGILNFLRPGLYTSYWGFYEMYVKYIDLYPRGRKVTGIRNEGLLRKELAPLMVRRLASEVLPGSPPVRFKTLRVQMEPVQARAYRQMAKEALVVLGDRAIEATHVLAQATRLRQLACSLGVLGPKDVSAKLDALIALIEEAPQEKFVVFTTFAEVLDLIEARLRKANITYVSLRGGMGSARIGATVKRFQSTPVQVLAGTVQTGGEGLDLTAARQMIFVNLGWSPRERYQAYKRVDRRGQARPVLITTLVCAGTIDETISRMLTRKEKATATVIAQEVRKDLEKEYS